MVPARHQAENIRLDHQEHDSQFARYAKLEHPRTKPAYPQSCVEMRFSKTCLKLLESLIYLLEVGFGARPGPAAPA